MRRAGLAALAVAASGFVLAGCMDGTVRDPPGEAAGGQGSGGKKKGSEAGQGGEDEGSGGGQAKPGAVSFAAVGDTAMGVTPELPPSPQTYFEPIEGELRADVVFGNLEGTLTDVSEDVKCEEDAKPGTCYAFRAPPEYAGYLHEAGFNVMSLANNHSYDFGEAGQRETVESLHRAGIEPVGIPGRTAFVEVGPTKIAFLGFASYDYTNSLTDLEGARALIRKARKRADVVVVANHAGAEGSDATHVTGETEIYLGEDRGNPEEFAHMAVEAGADLVLGSGPHVLRGMEIYRDRLIAYSLGNFSGFHNFDVSGVLGASAILHVTVDKDGAFRSGRISSVRLVEAGQPVLDSSGESADIIRELSHEDLGNSAVRIGDDGRILGTVGGG